MLLIQWPALFPFTDCQFSQCIVGLRLNSVRLVAKRLLEILDGKLIVASMNASACNIGQDSAQNIGVGVLGLLGLLKGHIPDFFGSLKIPFLEITGSKVDEAIEIGCVALNGA